MKISQVSIIFFLCTILISCSKDETPAPKPDAEDKSDSEPEKPKKSETEVYFTLDVNAINDLYTDVDYIILHDENGALLDFQLFSKGDKLVFEAKEGATISDKITVSHFNYDISPSNSKNFYRINTYTDVDKGSIWQFKNDDASYLINGSFEWEVTNLPDWKFYNLSSRIGVRYYQTSTGRFAGMPDADKSVMKDKGQTSPVFNDFFVSVIDGFNDLKYFTMKNVQPNDSIILDGDDLKFFDNYLNITIPQEEDFSHYIDAYESDQPYDTRGLRINFMTDWLLEQQTNEIKLGYLDSYLRFKTSIEFRTSGYYYTKYGSMPSSVEIPNEVTLSVLKENRTDFEFTTNMSFVRQESLWIYSPDRTLDSEDKVVVWRVQSPNSRILNIGELPAEIIAKFPNLELEKLEYGHTKLFVQGDSYKEFVYREFGNAKIQGEYIEGYMKF